MMDDVAQQALTPQSQAEATLAKAHSERGGIIQSARRYLTPRLGTAIVLWRLEARLALPLALVLVATLGRWPAAFTMGAIMAVFAFLFLFLLDGQRAVVELREWAYGHRFLGRYLRPIAERRDGIGAWLRILAVPVVIMLAGPFWRAVALLLFRARRLPAYVISIGGSIPHSLLWTGVILGGIWEDLLWPFLDSHWF